MCRLTLCHSQLSKFNKKEDKAMKTKTLRIFSGFLILFLILPFYQAAKTQSSDGEFAWVLVDIVDYEDEIIEHEAYAYTQSYSRGRYSASTTYTGQDYYGEGKTGTLAVEAQVEGVPTVIYPDVPIVLKVKVSTLTNTVVKLHFRMSFQADIDVWDYPPTTVSHGNISFVNEKGEYSFGVYSLSGPTSYNETITATMRAGSKEGDKKGLRTKFFYGRSLATQYVYEWKRIGHGVKEESKDDKNDKNKVFDKGPRVSGLSHKFWMDWEKEASKWTEADIQEATDPKNNHVKVKFGDLHGEVLVLRGWEDDQGQAVFVDLDTPLYHGDLILVSRRSRAILSFEDMRSLEIAPDTCLILDLERKEQTKLELIAGNIWMNLKRIPKGLSLEIPMGQACAGIKGTTFVCEEDNNISTVKVFEGEVEVTLNDTNEMVLVGAGQRVDVDKYQNYTLDEFDIEAELENWDIKTQKATKRAIRNASSSINPTVVVILLAVLVIGAGLAFIIYFSQKPKAKVQVASQAISQPRPVGYCTNCGTGLKAGQAFCPNCGKKV